MIKNPAINFIKGDWFLKPGQYYQVLDAAMALKNPGKRELEQHVLAGRLAVKTKTQFENWRRKQKYWGALGSTWRQVEND